VCRVGMRVGCGLRRRWQCSGLEIMVQGMDDKKKGRFTVSSVRWLITGAKREDWCSLTLGAQSRRNTTQNTERTKRHKPHASKQP